MDSNKKNIDFFHHGEAIKVFKERITEGVGDNVV